MKTKSWGDELAPNVRVTQYWTGCGLKVNTNKRPNCTNTRCELKSTEVGDVAKTLFLIG